MPEESSVREKNMEEQFSVPLIMIIKSKEVPLIVTSKHRKRSLFHHSIQLGKDNFTVSGLRAKLTQLA